jgi:hypothetical protein
MFEPGRLPLPVVDAKRLDRRLRAVLRPGELMRDLGGRARRLPRYFYLIDSWQTALQVPLAPRFMLWEFIGVDVREHELARTFPRLVPCAVTAMAAALETFRTVVGAPVHIAANGGYRSPAHRLSDVATPHCWATAVDVYRIGNEYLDTRETIEKYSRLALQSLPGLATRPYGHGRGEVDDHIHLELGYATLVPREAESEDGDGERGEEPGEREDRRRPG